LKHVDSEAVRIRFQEGVRMYPGYSPETAAALNPATRFALVHIDMDPEAPISAARLQQHGIL
jgi:hypothetical protein